MIVQLIIEVCAILLGIVLLWEFFVIACQAVAAPIWVVYKLVQFFKKVVKNNYHT